MARAKQTILKNIELSLTQTDAVGVALSEWASRGDWRLIFINRDRVRAVTPADVQRVAAGLPEAEQPDASACSSRPTSPTAPTFPRCPISPRW